MSVRSRSRGFYTQAANIVTSRIYDNCSHPVWYVEGTAASANVGVLETMNDTVIPNFASRRNKGEVFFNPMWKLKRESTITDSGYGPFMRAVTPITCSGLPKYTEYDFTGPWVAYIIRNIFGTSSSDPLPCFASLSGSDIDALATEVSTRCLANRGKAENNLFETFAEINQTLSLMQRPINTFSSFLTKVSKRAKLLGAAKAWLAYRYGVRPLVRDVTSIIAGLEKTVGKRRVTTRAKGTVSKNSYSISTFNSGFVKYQIGVQKTDTLQFKAVSLDEYVASVSSDIGFTAKGLITLPWELIPYSFVADWFVNIGDYLNALAPAPGYTMLGSCLTAERDTINLFSLSGSLISGTVTMSRQPTGSALSRITEKSRTVLRAPGLVVNQDFKFDSATRQADAISLLALRADKLFKR